MDVTNLVRQELSRGASVVKADNAWAGRDPALGTRKQLFVVIKLPSGQEQQLKSWEGEPLLLVEPGVAARPACKVLDETGRLCAWQPGTYRVKREDGTISTWRTQVPQGIPLNGPWTLAFPAGWGAPKTVELSQLVSWTELDLTPEARAFSGTATYTTEFTVGEPVTDAPLALDLGRVAVIASVEVNGQPAGVAWSPPYRLDITRMLKPGVNHPVHRGNQHLVQPPGLRCQPGGKCPAKRGQSRAPARTGPLCPPAYWARCLCESARSWALEKRAHPGPECVFEVAYSQGCLQEQPLSRPIGPALLGPFRVLARIAAIRPCLKCRVNFCRCSLVDVRGT